jgi:hypothetical protein
MVQAWFWKKSRHLCKIKKKGLNCAPKKKVQTQTGFWLLSVLYAFVVAQNEGYMAGGLQAELIQYIF